MLDQIQMMGLHGINDFALMGFHQSLDGMRKYLYWPPLFHQAPWWPFYPVFRDAVARSTGLTALGTRLNRYAIVYPQHELELVDPWNVELWQQKDNASQMINRLGKTIYQAGETIEFVFSHILNEAKVIEGKIVFPQVEYEAILAPDGIRYFDEDVAALEQIVKKGGKVLRENIDTVEKNVLSKTPFWSDKIQIQGEFGSIRLFQFTYPDGELFALRNVSLTSQSVTITSPTPLTQWHPIENKIEDGSNTIRETLISGATLYLSVSEKTISPCSTITFTQTKMDVDKWQILPRPMNTARLNQLRFRHNDGQWYEAIPLNRVGGQSICQRPFALPDIFFNYTDIPFEGSFECEEIPVKLGIIFEETHLTNLCVNGQLVNWSIWMKELEFRIGILHAVISIFKKPR